VRRGGRGKKRRPGKEEEGRGHACPDPVPHHTIYSCARDTVPYKVPYSKRDHICSSLPSCTLDFESSRTCQLYERQPFLTCTTPLIGLILLRGAPPPSPSLSELETQEPGKLIRDTHGQVPFRRVASLHRVSGPTRGWSTPRHVVPLFWLQGQVDNTPTPFHLSAVL